MSAPMEPDQVYRPSDELDQRDEIGGTDELGREVPQTPVPVLPVGLVLTRPTPALIRVSNGYVIDAGAVISVVGPTPQRRRLVISATEAVRLGDSAEALTVDTAGFHLPADTLFAIEDAAAVFVRGLVNGTGVTYWHEMNAG